MVVRSPRDPRNTTARKGNQLNNARSGGGGSVSLRTDEATLHANRVADSLGNVGFFSEILSSFVYVANQTK